MSSFSESPQQISVASQVSKDFKGAFVVFSCQNIQAPLFSLNFHPGQSLIEFLFIRETEFQS